MSCWALAHVQDDLWQWLDQLDWPSRKCLEEFHAIDGLVDSEVIFLFSMVEKEADVSLDDIDEAIVDQLLVQTVITRYIAQSADDVLNHLIRVVQALYVI